MLGIPDTECELGQALAVFRMPSAIAHECILIAQQMTSSNGLHG